MNAGDKIQIYDRQHKQLREERQYQAGLLKFLYGTLSGRILLKLFISTPLFSRFYAFSVKSRRSKKKILPFIERYQIDMSEFQEEDYPNFDAFFTRRIKPEARGFSPQPAELCAPADARLMAYPITDDLTFTVKNSQYSVQSLLKNDQLAEKYRKGCCLVFRLTVTDYHRYCYIDEGRTKESQKVKGRLHTVSPISLAAHEVYAENSRVWTVLATENFGEVVQVEVGALLVGRITNHSKKNFSRGEEKGYFSYGGSTIILLFKEGQITVDSELWQWTQRGVECTVKLGEKIGVGKNVI
ncbi:phosphatidylserine decarboxylase [Enterococcus sp. LJL51]|uniref:phosphatidylserine decarboxylase n=1 Tax=Enterococcus sp. LJL51 TaxID=3416656 RepID=UPI003CF6997C